MIPLILVFPGLVVGYHRFRFSNISYALMAFWLFWHTLGAYYTFAKVPFEWFGDLAGSERSHFMLLSSTLVKC